MEKRLRLSALILAVIFISFIIIPDISASASDARARFDTGSAVNSKWASLARSKANVTAIKRYTGESVPEGAQTVLISSSSSELPILSWFDEGTIFYFTEDPSPMTDRDSSFMFNGFSNAEIVDVGCFDTSETEDMESMFSNLKKAKVIDVSGFDTSKVKCMYCMFYNCSSAEELDVSRFDTRNSVNTSDGSYGSLCGMFIGCASIRELDLSSFDMTQTSWPYHTQNFIISCPLLERLVLGPNCRFNGFTAFSGNWTKEDDGTTLSGAQLCASYNSANAMSLSGVWHRDMPEGHFYRTDGSLDEQNLWEVHTPLDRFKGYCLNLNRFGVGETLDRVLVTGGSDVEKHLCSDSEGSSHGYAPLGADMREALITLIYYGWPNDGAGIQQRYGLSDRRYMEITQNAVWDFTDRYDDPVGPGLFEGDELAAYEELVTQNYSSIEGLYDLFLYISWDPTQQNLLSIMGVDDGIYGGVSVRKSDADGSVYLADAEFTVYDEEGMEVGAMTTGAGGEAYLCRTDHWAGLPVGTYTVKETKAPAGYEISDKTFRFEITEPNVIVSTGLDLSKEEPVPEEMIFYDAVDEDYRGGGIGIVKKSSDGKMLAGAEFTVYASDGSVAALLVTNDAGIAVTGAMDLPYGTYTVMETRTPQGYVCSEEVFTAEINEDTPFLTFTFTDGVKYGSVVLEAFKVLDVEGASLKGGEFAFELTDAKGTVLQTKYNDPDGRIVFDEIVYSSADLGYQNYHIREVIPDDWLYHYDTHQEDITVTIHDTESDALDCEVAYDVDGAVFTNTEAGEIMDIGFAKIKLNTSDPVIGASLELRDEGGRLIKTWMSGEDPFVVSIPSGKYFLIEVSAPEGYEKAAKVSFELFEDGSVELEGPASFDGESMTVSIYDRLVGSVSMNFTKRSEEDLSPLPGAVFLLKGTGESTYSASAESASDGAFSFDGLESGTYVMTEQFAPDGYEPSEGEWTVSVEHFLKTAGTPNVDSAGDASQSYPTSFTDKKTVTAPEGTERIHIDLTWQTEDDYDYLEIYSSDGELITEDADGNTIGDPYRPGRFWGGLDDGTMNHASFELAADEVIFYFYSDPGVTAYGYHAVVSTPDRVTLTGPSGTEISPSGGSYDILNKKSAAPQFVELTVIKVWEDDEDASGKRPSTVEGAILADGTEIERFTLSGEEDWRFTAQFPMSDENGKEITYTVNEKPVPGYTSSVSPEGTYTFIITNTFTGGGGGIVPGTGYQGRLRTCIIMMLSGAILLYLTGRELRRR